MGLAVTAVLLWIAADATVAGATTRYRSGIVRAQLVNHVTAGGSTAPAGYVANGADVIAGMVAVAGLLAFAFIVVTLIRRRSTAA